MNRQQQTKWRTFLWLVPLFFFLSCQTEEHSYEFVHRQLSAAIQMEDSDAVMALNIYEEALDNLLENPDSSLLSETHFRMGLLFLRWSLPEECIASMKQAYLIDSLRLDTFAMAKSLRGIAFAYESSGMLDEARQIASEKLTKLPTYRSNDKNEFKYKHLKRYEKMLQMKMSLPSSFVGESIHLTPNSNELDTVFEGWIAEDSGLLDTAFSYYDQLVSARSYYVRAFAQLHLARLCLKVGNKGMAEDMLNGYEATNALIRKGELTTKKLLQCHACYQDKRSQKTIGQLQLNIRNQWKLMMGVFSVGMLLIIVLLLWIRVYRQRQVILRFKVDKLRQWREAYLLQGDQNRQEIVQSTQLTDIYQLLRMKLNGADSTKMTDNDWDALEQTILAAYPSFRQRLYSLCRLSPHDYHVCLLLKMGIKPSDVARLTIRSDEAISSTRRRLFQRAFGRKGTPGEWDEIIKTI